ncbi:delta-aminolevulinic acid dehydratase [Thermosipho melanesiensis]|uniref:Delta-aminolevulinic acid dehydratase n=2 Tax=Thermosipho melanesiensis TaxID=46541 RepID=A6LKX2_THEM4|nr:porphobilinogen synthase [Thermosipho melanesiensis]ABR30573.1 Porphobilinogen synthase [Thermosipho melanesiensis BI429]APT73721.1 delta-aminolevulinic acid dehydratase [Thermosipho melanesiensis]OOC35659.1 delta-aminolevulinic acid dehydratase [Thermosipho melanesiensis]OOC38958.1 delta-aminolevulinic acid dehydratase [Thermosipho melanesiensis]OOC39106.1 delta-aminolevulinic acid dehydratase [Thermosipho melanesiensis]
MKRLRRLRNNETIRSLIRETHLTTNDLIYPLFIKDGYKIKEEIPSMPEIFRLSIDMAIDEIKTLRNLGINAFLLFGVPNKKDLKCINIVNKALEEIKSEIKDAYLITDVCLCSYTEDGHCGITKDGIILNDESVELLSEISLSYAQSGADMIAPSDMMDGRVKKIRKTLDKNNFSDIPIMSYSAKFASSFYGPFRDAANSAPKFGDRKTYQLDIANKNEALREIALDIEEGADIVMIKPALSFLDIVEATKRTFNIPVAVYNVSGEYSMVKAAAQKGWIDEKEVVLETLTSMKRAGADIIITYHAKDVAKWLSYQ